MPDSRVFSHAVDPEGKGERGRGCSGLGLGSPTCPRSACAELLLSDWQVEKRMPFEKSSASKLACNSMHTTVLPNVPVRYCVRGKNVGECTHADWPEPLQPLQINYTSGQSASQSEMAVFLLSSVGYGSIHCNPRTQEVGQKDQEFQASLSYVARHGPKTQRAEGEAQ